MGGAGKEIGGDRSEVYQATSGLQDPHRIAAKPSLIARARSAQLVVATGAELEIGWLPLVIRDSGNERIRVGQPGYFEAAAQVTLLLEVPKVLDRSQGDVHAAGNPHVQTDPRNILRIGEALAERMALLGPGEAPACRAGLQAFATWWRAAIARWESAAAPLRGVPVLVRTVPSVPDGLAGDEGRGHAQAKPGVEASGTYLAEVLARLSAQPHA